MTLTPWKKSYDKPRQHIQKQRHYFANKGPSSQSYGFSSGHVWMWVLDYKESRVPKNWCFWTAVLEKTLESPLDCKEIKPVHPKGDQSWVFIGKTDVEAETPILWPRDAKSWLIGKDSDAGIGGRRRRGWQRMRWSDGITNLMDMGLGGLPEFTQTHVHRVSDAIQPSHPLSSPSPPAPNPSIRVFSNESTLCMSWPKYWSFSFSIIPSKEHAKLIYNE